MVWQMDALRVQVITLLMQDRRQQPVTTSSMQWQAAMQFGVNVSTTECLVH